MELSFRTIRLFHVDDNEDNVGEEEDGNRTESLASIQLHDDDAKEERYGVDRCFEPWIKWSGGVLLVFNSLAFDIEYERVLAVVKLNERKTKNRIAM